MPRKTFSANRESGTAPLLRASVPFVAAAAVPAVVLTGVAPAHALSGSAGLENAPQMSVAVQKLIAQHRAALAQGVPANTVAAKLPVSALSAVPPQTYTVRDGDTVSAVAARYGLDVNQVLRANQLGPNTLIFPGDTLRLGSGPASDAGNTGSNNDGEAAPAPSAKSAGNYTVKPGDTISGIAASQRVDTQTLLDLNALTASTVIFPGQVIKLSQGVQVQGQGQGSPEDEMQLVPGEFGGVRYPDQVVGDANSNKRILMNSVQPSQDQMQSIVAQVAADLGVDPALAQAVAYQESGFQQSAVSPANAIGTMQVIPGTGDWASELVGRKLNLLDAYDNATAGVAILRALVSSSNNLDEAIGSYYQGQGSIRSRGMYDDTKAYVASVKAHMARFGG